MSSIKLSHVVPFLPTANIQETIQFYQNQLGFDDLWIWDEPPTVIRLGRGPVKFLFNLDPEHPVLQKGFDIMVFMSGIEELYKAYQEQGLAFSEVLELKPWGIWEFSIRDNNGYFLRFADERPKE
ncbi:MAG: hypothetical protein HKN76_17785 [Saprospiraceae bacterium]|nr:hypothetical protein [Saprospiraceae bacterium]